MADERVTAARGPCRSGPPTCAAKRAAGNVFRTRQAAKRLAKRMRSAGRAVQYYRCRWCPYWHVGRPEGV
jgi:rubrerythrin